MNKNQDILYIAIFTLLTVFAWIIFEVYHTTVTTTVTEVQRQLVRPLDPVIDQTKLSNTGVAN